MKSRTSTIWAVVLLLLAATLYRLIPARPAGFAPQMAMALFGGAIFTNKKLAILLPLVSLFISDAIFQLLFNLGMSDTMGFYSGQWGIYLIFILIGVLGTWMKKKSVTNVILFSIAGSVLFFVLSNFVTWATGTGFGRPFTPNGFLLCNIDALAYYRSAGLINGFDANFILGDLIWSAVLFGSYYMLKNFSSKPVVHTA